MRQQNGGLVHYEVTGTLWDHCTNEATVCTKVYIFVVISLWEYDDHYLTLYMGSFGYTMESFGFTMGSFGYTMGSFGYTMGSFRYTVGSFGYTIGSFGHTMGSFVLMRSLYSEVYKCNCLISQHPVGIGGGGGGGGGGVEDGANGEDEHTWN